MRFLSPIAFVLAPVLVSGPASSQTTWFVDAAGVPPGTGTPGDPFTSIQYAIAQPTTVGGDAVIVLPGVYQEGIDFLGKGILVRSAQGPEATVLLGDPLADPPHSVVRFASGETRTSILRGFTVREGNGTPSGTETLGGGIFIDQASPALVELVVEDNWATRGGGLYARTSDLSMLDCTFRLNRALASGGAAHLEDAGTFFTTRTATGCRFIENWTENGPGGAVYMASGQRYKSFTLCEFRGNRAEGGHAGGAIYSTGAWFGVGDSLFLRNEAAAGAAAAVYWAWCGAFARCEFVENDSHDTSGAFFGGGAIHTGNSCLLLNDSLFQGNLARGGNMFGGAVSAWDTELTVTRCVFTQNHSDRDGGAVYYSANPQEWRGLIGSSTLVANQATFGKAVRALGHLDITNSIVWNGDGALNLSLGGTAAAVTYTDVQGGYPGLGNIDEDPLFWDLEGGDYHLRPGSPCIDAGNPAQTDPDGSRIDMGAFPFDPDYCPSPVRYCAAKVSSAGCLPAIGHQGQASLSGPDDFLVEATSILNQQPVVLFWGLAAAETPFGGGLLCVAAPLSRTAPQSSGGNPAPPSDCSGTASFHFSQAYLLGAGLQAGDAVHAQYWYRDSAHADGTGLGLTDALRFWICP